MSSNSFRALAFLALAGAAGPLAGCDESAEVDLGARWVPGSKIEPNGWLAWSPDASRLFWVGLDNESGTHPLLSMTRANEPLSPVVPDTGDGPNPQVVNDARTVFFTKRQADTHEVILLRSSVSDGVGGVPVEVARDVFSYLAAPDGARVVFSSASVAGPQHAIDIGSGTVVAMPEFYVPTAFSPDATRLLMKNTAAGKDTSRHYAMVDPATGAKEDVSYPSNDSIDLVVRWENNRPRVVIGGLPRTIDLVTGETTFLGWDSVAGLSGDAADPAAIRFAYGWDSECLGPFVPMSTGVGTACRSTQFRLHRTDLVTGAIDLIGLAAEHVPATAFSRDGGRFAAVGHPWGPLYVKELRPAPASP